MNILISYDHRREELERLPLAVLAERVLAAEGAPCTTEVSLSFIDDAVMAQLNERYRGKTGPTDVLSFECDAIPQDVPADQIGAQVPVCELGDVIIAPDVAERQAAEYGQTFAQEIELLLVHGLLHLCGYDHLVEDEARIMEAREEALLADWRAGEGRS
ncbi:rRNA maturation RNase YbeY [Adlercreutzia murintestinalis]|uniref:rRNA maturation RNase YbeY n=1 Tax=Adlercreutzia murintestinalis TaxID=2941325 RepID=UPI00203BB557|nr:rRNA maturation RNase YbeY [Adlercreutzia murintestinalis]